MSSRMNEDFSSIRIDGDPMRIEERPSSISNNSNSSIISRRFTPKNSARPSSALPRLCSRELIQDDLNLQKEKRPYSADFGIPTSLNLLSGKSKETLTDGSFESIYVDYHLPSSNLFKELLRENVEDWRENTLNTLQNLDENLNSTILKSVESLNAQPEKEETVLRNSISSTHKPAIKTVNKDGINEMIMAQEMKGGQSEFNEEILPEKQSKMPDKYALAPGLTSKPPLPKKLNSPQVIATSHNSENDAIYDYFAIKYNLQQASNPENANENLNYSIENEDEISYPLSVEENSEKENEDSNKAKRKVEIVEQPESDDNSSRWIEEINVIQEQELETDRYFQEVKKRCQSSSSEIEELNNDNIPLLSEIDIDELFKLENVEETNGNSQLSSTQTRETSNKGAPSPLSKTKMQMTTKKTNKKTPGRTSKTNKKTEFAPVKLNSKSDSPRNIQEENAETWGTETRPSRKTQEFSELLDKVEDLRSVTQVISGNPENSDPPPLSDNKQGNFDDIETIIEALEHQDKTSQINIKTMRKIVKSELSDCNNLNEEKNKLENIEEEKIEGDLCEHHKRILEKSEIPHKTAHPCCNNIRNYKELLSYLDEVDKKCTKTLEVAKERAQTVSKLVMESTNSFDTIPKVEDLLSYCPEELASYIIDLSLRIKDKTSCIGLLQNELSTLRERIMVQNKQSEQNLRQKLKEQKVEAEKIMKRHQKFIDQLMDEKKSLAKRCEELVEEMRLMEEKYVANMRAIEHRHQVEMQKMKDMHAASERLRRERWIEGRTQKIKEMAVKSIEPEVERMEKRHQEELSNMRSLHKREIEELELRAARKLQEHSEQLREQLIEDREKALAHERDVMRLRYEKLVESEEKNYQEQRRRLQADHANRLAELEEREAQCVAERDRLIRAAQEEFEEKLNAAARRHANEVKLVKETAAIEMENWKNSFRKQQSALLMEKETSIRRECKKDRDREIELVIERLENEANKAKSQMEQTTENRIKRIRQKYEAEMRDLEMLEKDAQNKYCEARTKVIEYEEVMLTLRTTIKQLEHQITDETLKRSKLEAEREEIRETIRKEYIDKIRSLEGEVEHLRASADKHVEQLYARVRVSLSRKDELLAELTNDHKALKEKCAFLENIIEQQRKEFVMNS